MIRTLCVIVLAWIVVIAKPNDYEQEKDICEAMKCIGEGYECINRQCYCAHGYMPNPFQNRCVRCPGLGDKCFMPCCSYGNTTLTCWQGVCRNCYDATGAWICRETIDHIFLVSTSQIAMASALVLGIIATFILLYRLCAATNLRPIIGSGVSNGDGRLSIGSLQMYVDERLRDAPPRYTRTAPPGTAAIPATVYINSGFIHDYSVPPPPYSQQKDENSPQTASSVHI